MTNISLVGFGRIGRDLFRQTLGDEAINIVSISENTPPPKFIVVDTGNSTQLTEPDNSTIEILDNDRVTISNDTSDSNFEIGLIMGIIVGVAIGISMFLIIRQKNT